MIFLFTRIIAMTSALAAQQAVQRQRAGLPPLVVEPKSPEQLAKEKREDLWERICFSIICTIWAAPFVALPILIIYVVIKFMFAKQGMKWP